MAWYLSTGPRICYSSCGDKLLSHVILMFRRRTLQ